MRMISPSRKPLQHEDGEPLGNSCGESGSGRPFASDPYAASTRSNTSMMRSTIQMSKIGPWMPPKAARPRERQGGSQAEAVARADIGGNRRGAEVMWDR